LFLLIHLGCRSHCLQLPMLLRWLWRNNELEIIGHRILVSIRYQRCGKTLSQIPISQSSYLDTIHLKITTH
jgi:hypothetical protein